MHQVNIIFPCYNPHKRWKEDFVYYAELLKKNWCRCKYQFCNRNDGSFLGFHHSDIDHIKSRFPECRILHHERNRGKGQAIRSGVESCVSGHIIYCDIDFPFGVEPIREIIKILIHEDVVVFGKRDDSYSRNLSFLRKYISKMYASIIKIFLPGELSSCQAGILGFNNSMIPYFLETKIDRFLFSTEFARIVRKKKLNFRTVELSLRDIKPHTTINKRSMIQEASNLIYLFTKINLFKN